MPFHTLALIIALFTVSHAVQAAEVCASRVIAAPIDEVWLRIRDFGSHADWIKGSPKVWLEGGAGTTVGVKSYTQFSDGDVYVETLTALDDKAHTLKYDVIGELPLPIYNASGAFRLYPVTKDNSTLIERCLYYDTSLPKEKQAAFAKGRTQVLASSLDLLSDLLAK